MYVFQKTVLHCYMYIHAFNVHVIYARKTYAREHVCLYHIRYIQSKCTRHIRICVFQKTVLHCYIYMHLMYMSHMLAKHMHMNTVFSIILDA